MSHQVNCIRCNDYFLPNCQYYHICRSCEATMKKAKTCGECGDEFIPFKNMDMHVTTSTLKQVTSKCFMCLHAE